MKNKINKWQTTYPTLSTVKIASFETLQTWEESLPKPQTDVEVTIMKKIKNQIFRIIAEEVKEKEPSIAEQWNNLSDELSKHGIYDLPKM